MSRMQYMLVLIAFALFSCVNPQYTVIEPEYKRVVDLMFFSGRKNSKDSVYSIEREYSNVHQFVLKHKGSIFFKGDHVDNEYVFEGFRKKYFFITPIPTRHYLSSPFLAERDSVFLYDLQSKRLYNFNAKEYMILAYRQVPTKMTTEKIGEMRRKNYRVTATYDSLDIGKNELYLLLDDHKTREVIKLEPVQGL